MKIDNANLPQEKPLTQTHPLESILVKKISFSKALFYIIILCLAVETFMLISSSIFSSDIEILFQEVGVSSPRSQAMLYILPAEAKYKVGDEFKIDVLVDTRGKNIVVAAAYLSYNKNKLQALDIDLSDSDFRFTAEKEINQKDGKIKITLGQPTPGIKSDKGKIASVRFKALESTDVTNNNIYFDFTRHSSHYSTVILDDKKGTNILSLTQGASVIIEE